MKACDVATQAPVQTQAPAQTTSASAAAKPSSAGNATGTGPKPASNGATILESYAIAAAQEASGGQATSAYQANIDGHGWVWVVTTKDASGNVITYYVDNYGNPYNADHDANSNQQVNISESDAVAAAESASGGKSTGAWQVFTNNHGMCWQVNTVDSNGNVLTYHVDSNGNPFNADYE